MKKILLIFLVFSTLICKSQVNNDELFSINYFLNPNSVFGYETIKINEFDIEYGPTIPKPKTSGFFTSILFDKNREAKFIKIKEFDNSEKEYKIAYVITEIQSKIIYQIINDFGIGFFEYDTSNGSHKYVIPIETGFMQWEGIDEKSE